MKNEEFYSLISSFFTFQKPFHYFIFHFFILISFSGSFVVMMSMPGIWAKCVSASSPSTVHTLTSSPSLLASSGQSGCLSKTFVL